MANPANVTNPANVANAVFRQVAVPPQRDAAMLLWPGLFATDSLALDASGKGVWRATARPEKAFEIIEGPRRTSLTNRDGNRRAFHELCRRRSQAAVNRIPCLAAGLIFHHQRLEAGLKQMADGVVPPIKPHTVVHVQSLHRAAQVGLRRLRYQVKVVVHQHVGANPEPEPVGQLPQQPEKVRAVGLFPVNRPCFVAASGHVMAPTRALDA